MGCLQRRHLFLRSRLKINPAAEDAYLMEEWRAREKEIPVIGQPLVEFWLLQVR